MGKERRKQIRYTTDLNSSLYLGNGKNGSRISSSLDCRGVDFSRTGVGIITHKIFVDNQHFFYAALDSDEVVLVLEIAVPEKPNEPTVLTFLGRPVWFDRLLDQEQKPFKMGIRFLEKVSDDNWRLLQQHGLIGKKE